MYLEKVYGRGGLVLVQGIVERILDVLEGVEIIDEKVIVQEEVEVGVDARGHAGPLQAHPGFEGVVEVGVDKISLDDVSVLAMLLVDEEVQLSVVVDAEEKDRSGEVRLATPGLANGFPSIQVLERGFHHKNQGKFFDGRGAVFWPRGPDDAVVLGIDDPDLRGVALLKLAGPLLNVAIERVAEVFVKVELEEEDQEAKVVKGEPKRQQDDDSEKDPVLSILS